ncbi:MarR family winged helix-turn-helix transcriptional regulator [Methylobacterium sp. A54F]
MTRTDAHSAPPPAEGQAETDLAEPIPAGADPLRVWFRFIRLSRRVTAAVGADLREIGLSIPQFDVLSTLTEREGLTQQELAARLYVTKGNVSGLIDRLVEAGLVERRAIPGDRRSHALHLTPTGADLAARGIAAQEAYVRRTLGRLAPETLAAFEGHVLEWRALARADAEGR